MATRRAGFTALAVKNFTLALDFSSPGLENPGPGFEKPKPGPVTPKAGTEKKEENLGHGSLPFAKANIGIEMRNSKSAFPELTI